MNRLLLTVLAFAVVYQVSGEPGPQDGLIREVRQVLGHKPGHRLAAEDHIYCGTVLEQNREAICGVMPASRLSKRNAFVGKEEASDFLKRGVRGLGEECCGEGCTVEEISESC